MTHRFLLISAVLPLSLALITGCTGGQPDAAPPHDGPGPDAQADSPADAQPGAADDGAWRAEVLLDTGSKLSGVAVGDLLPEVPGNEIVTVGTDRKMRLIWRSGEECHHEVIATLPGEMIQVDVGDVDPDRPGDEIMAVGVTSGGEDDPGAKGAAVYVRREGDAWKAVTVFEDTALLHGVCIQSSGVWVTGYSNQIHLLGRQDAGPWPAHSAPLPGPGRSIAPTAGGVTVACKDGSVVDVSLSGVLGPVPMLRDKRDVGRARIAAVADTDVLAADDDGTLTLLTTGADGRPERAVLHKGPDKLRGAVLADLDTTSPGLEAATAGYDGTLRAFTFANEEWREAIVARDTDRFHHLTSGVLPGWDGMVLIGVNYSGKVTVAGKAQ